MKCQILFSGKNKKNIINLPSAENAQRVVKVKALIITTTDNTLKRYFYFSEKIRHDISDESSAQHTIHMKSHALFSLEKKPL